MAEYPRNPYPLHAPPSYEVAIRSPPVVQEVPTVGPSVPAVPVEEAEGSEEDGGTEVALDDLDILPSSYFKTYDMPDFSECAFYSEEFVRRLYKFATLHCARGPLFSLTRQISGLRWVPLDDTYYTLSLAGRTARFWITTFVNTVTMNKSKRPDVPPVEIILNSCLPTQTSNLCSLVGPHYPEPPPWTNMLRFISVSGTELVTNNIYDARDGFYFERQMPRLRPGQLTPDSVVVMEFIVTQRGGTGSVVRELRAQNIYALWLSPVVPPGEVATDAGPSLARMLGLD